MARIPDVGAEAPDFTLPSLTLSGGVAVRAELTLSGQRGHPVVLAFYPGDETPVCTRQMCAYSNDLAVFDGLGARVCGISPQGLDSHERFARHHGLGMPLLADVDRAVISAYGVAMAGIGVRRSVFVVDAGGIVRWRRVALVGLTFPDAATIAMQVAAAQV
jgi:peroxiredoxin Q/BCP